MKRLILASIISAFAVTTVFAQSMPKGATKLTPAEIQKVYSGKRGEWGDIRGYFYPTGQFVSYDARKSEWWFEGRWTVKGNVMCLSGNGHGVKDGSVHPLKQRDCNTWIREKNGALKQSWSQSPGWSDGLKNLKQGDGGVVRKVNALKAKTPKS